MHVRDGDIQAPGGVGGFTFIELMIVVAIVTLAAVLVVPQIASSASFEVEGAARAVHGDLLYAQSEAQASQARRAVVFDAAANRYRVTDESGATLSAAWLGGAYVVAFGQASRFGRVRIENPDFGGAAEVSFDALGTPSGGGSVDVVAGDRRYRVRVTAYTGRIRVEEVTGS